jgi:hypothetical protein
LHLAAAPKWLSQKSTIRLPVAFSSFFSNPAQRASQIVIQFGTPISVVGIACAARDPSNLSKIANSPTDAVSRLDHRQTGHNPKTSNGRVGDNTPEILNHWP